MNELAHHIFCRATGRAQEPHLSSHLSPVEQKALDSVASRLVAGNERLAAQLVELPLGNWFPIVVRQHSPETCAQ